MTACLEGLSEAQLNWRPAIEGANSAYVIAAHTLGNARAWVLGIACGQPVERDRQAEFRASGAAGGLAAAARELSGEIEAALAALTPAELDRRLVPSQSLWGEGEAQVGRAGHLHAADGAAVGASAPAGPGLVEPAGW